MLGLFRSNLSAMPTIATTTYTVEDLANAWIETGTRIWAPSTQRARRDQIERISRDLGHHQLEDLTPNIIEQYLLDLAAGTDTALPLGAASVHRYLVTLIGMFNQAVDWRWIDTSPTDGIVRMRPRTRLRNLDAGGVLRAVRTISTDTNLGVLVRLAAVTGARRGELCALQVSDLDFDKRTVRFARAITIGPGGELFEGPTKTRSIRTVGVDHQTMWLIAGRLDAQVELARRLGRARADDPYVFSPKTSGAKPYNPESITTMWNRALRPHGLGHLRFNDVRHHAVTRMLYGGIPIGMVSRRVGHSTPMTTLRYYAHALPVDDHDASDVLASLVDGVGAGSS